MKKLERLSFNRLSLLNVRDENFAAVHDPNFRTERISVEGDLSSKMGLAYHQENI